MPTVAEATMAVLERPRELVRVIANARPAEPVHESVPLAALLAACAGFLDAFTYVRYDHVLANSMSGNVVLAGIAVTTGQWHQIWWHLLPIMAFLAGVWAAETLRLPRVRAVVRHPTAACLGLETAFLTIAAGSAHIPAALMTSGISFVAAAQTTTFRQLRGTPYHSVVMTGNLRSFGTDSFVGLFTGDAGQRRDAARFGAVCLAFATGAAIGGWSTPTLGNPALLIVAGLLTLVLVMLHGRIPLLRHGSRCDRFPPRLVVAAPSEDEHGRTDASMRQTTCCPRYPRGYPQVNDRKLRTAAVPKYPKRLPGLLVHHVLGRGTSHFVYFDAV